MKAGFEYDSRLVLPVLLCVTNCSVFLIVLSVHCFLVNMFFWFFELGLDVEISGIEPCTVETDVQVSKYSKTLIICHEFLLTVMVVNQCCGRCRRKSAFIFF